jgi:hypothetical protein
LTNHHRNLLAAKHLLVDGPLAQCQPKIVCDPLVETRRESYRLADAKRRNRQAKPNAASGLDQAALAVTVTVDETPPTTSL